jgi:mRNA interferase RelE/StbE
MKQYKIVIAKRVWSFLDTQSQKQRERILKAVYKLPYEGDISPMTGRKGYFRLRVGPYRVIYSIHESILTIEVLAAGNRGDVYKS